MAKTPPALVRERWWVLCFSITRCLNIMTVFDNVAFGLRMRPKSSRPTEAQIRDKVIVFIATGAAGLAGRSLSCTAFRWPAPTYCLGRALWPLNRACCCWMSPLRARCWQVRKELRRWLRKLHDELHVTSIFVTHDQEEALEVADRVVLMNFGKVEQIGTP